MFFSFSFEVVPVLFWSLRSSDRVVPPSPAGQTIEGQLGRSWQSSYRTPLSLMFIFFRVNLVIFIFYFVVFDTFRYLVLWLVASSLTGGDRETGFGLPLWWYLSAVTQAVFLAFPAVIFFLCVFASNSTFPSLFYTLPSSGRQAQTACTYRSISAVRWFIFLLLVFGCVFGRLPAWWHSDICPTEWHDTLSIRCWVPQAVYYWPWSWHPDTLGPCLSLDRTTQSPSCADSSDLSVATIFQFPAVWCSAT